MVERMPGDPLVVGRSFLRLHGGSNNTSEIIGADMRGTRCLQEATTRLHQPDSQLAQFSIGPDRSVLLAGASGERWRIDHHDVVALVRVALCCHHLERIADGARETHMADLFCVVFEISLRGGDRRCRDINRVHEAGTTRSGVDREPTRAGKHIEHRSVVSYGSNPLSVVALVEEMTGLLAVKHIGLERQTILQKQHRPRDLRSKEHHAIDKTKRHGLGRLRYVSAQAQDNSIDTLHRGELGDDRTKMRVPRDRIHFNDEGVRVSIRDEGTDAIVLPEEHAVPRGVRAAERLACGNGRIDNTGPVSIIDRERLARVQYANSNRRVGVPQADGGERPVVIEHHRQRSGWGRRVTAGDRVGVDPGVATSDLAQGIFCHPHRNPPFGNCGKRVEVEHV